MLLNVIFSILYPYFIGVCLQIRWIFPLKLFIYVLNLIFLSPTTQGDLITGLRQKNGNWAKIRQAGLINVHLFFLLSCLRQYHSQYSHFEWLLNKVVNRNKFENKKIYKALFGIKCLCIVGPAHGGESSLKILFVYK